MTDRYDEVMLGLYRGAPPAWVPEASRALFLRESVRRRCALGQSLKASWRCTMYYARGVISEDIALDVFTAWPEYRATAPNVATGLYLALDQVLRGHRAVWELFQYESLAVRDLACEPAIPRAGDEVFRFSIAIEALHTHMTLYESAAAPAAFTRDYRVVDEPTLIARTRSGERILLEAV